MDLRAFNKKDYETIIGWWLEHKHPIVPIEMLSPFGMIASNSDSKDVAVCFMYLPHGCDIAQLCWSTTNPSVSLRNRYEGIDCCIKGLIAVAKENKRTNIVSFSDSTGLNKIYSKNGLKELKDHKLMYSKLGAF